METGDTNKSDNVGNIFDKHADGIGDTSLIPPASIQRNAQSSMSNEASPESDFQHSLIQMMISAQSQQTLMFSKIMERIESGENSSRGKGEDIAAGQSNNTTNLTSLKRKSDNRDGSMPSTSKQSKTDADLWLFMMISPLLRKICQTPTLMMGLIPSSKKFLTERKYHLKMLMTL
jgi:hypothetical protein